MDMFASLLPAIVSGAFSFLGGERRNQAQATSARDAREFNAHEAVINREFQAAEAKKGRDFTAAQMRTAAGYNQASQKRAMDFAERMSSSANQRAVEDLRAAGLNPILAAGGRAASSPGAPAPGVAGGTGPTASGTPTAAAVQAQMEDSVGKAAASASNVYRMTHETRQMRQATKESKQREAVGAQQEKLTEVDRQLRTQSVHTERERTAREAAETQAASARAVREIEAAKQHTAQTSALKAQERLSTSAAALRDLEHQIRSTELPGRQTEQEIDETAYGRALRYIRRALPAFNSARGVIPFTGRGGPTDGTLRRIERRLNNLPRTRD